MVDVWQERMSDAMLKIHVPGLGVIHHFTDRDLGPHHSHPWRFRSIILKGGYVEEVLHPDGKTETIERKPGATFEIAPDHVHRIIALPTGECWTCIDVLGPKVQEPGFFEWRDGRMFYRQWDAPDWTPA